LSTKPASTTTAVPLHAELDEFCERGLRLYEERLKAILEPEFNGQVVAIDVESGDYEVVRVSREAWGPLRERHPQARVFITDVGPPKPCGFSIRMQAEIQAAARETR
jgi:hypothetical protein